MPGNGTYGSSAFVISDQGYVTTGWERSGGSGYPTIFNYKYDPASNIWISISAFPVSGRYTASAFSINGKGYVGMGYAPLTNDLWQYDPVTNAWTQKANIPATARQAGIGFSIGSFGYLGMGGSYALQLTDLWQYDPQGNSWLQKTSLPDSARSASSVFILNNQVFLIGGSDYYDTPFQNVYKYDPVADSWTFINQFPGGPRFCMSEGQANNKGYCGQGSYTIQNTGNYATTNDWWELSLTTGIKETENQNSFAVFPNPAKEILNIKFSDLNVNIESLKIFDTKGALIFTQKNILSSSTVDISNIKKGEYIIQLQIKNSLLSKSFVKE
jgi:hypothetical protein